MSLNMLKNKRLFAVGSGIIFYILLKNRKSIKAYLRTHIESILGIENPDDKVEVITEYVLIPKEAVSSVLGTNGAVLRKIERQTKVFLRMLPLSCMKEEEESLNKLCSWDVEIAEFKINLNVDIYTQSFVKLQSCSRENIELARAALKSVLSQFQEECVEDSLEAPTKVLGHIIGVGGRNIKRISTTHNVKIRIQKVDEQDERNVIRLRGSKERVVMAKDAICKSIRRQGNRSGEDELEQAFQEFSYTEGLTKELKDDEYW